MVRHREIRGLLVGVVVLATIALSASPSWGTSIAADAFLPTVGAPLGPGATFALRAFSVAFAPTPGGPNSIRTPATATLSPVPIIVFSRVPRIYAPTVTLSGNKSAPPTLS